MAVSPSSPALQGPSWRRCFPARRLLFVSYYWDERTNTRLIIATESWAGKPLLVARSDTTGNVIALPWQSKALQYSAPNCVGTAYAYEQDALSSWVMEFVGYPQGVPQLLAIYSEALPGGGCFNYTTIDTYSVVPIVPVTQPPTYSGTLRIELN